MKSICFYHKADLDGVCSAAIVKHSVPGVELLGIDYGEEFPWDKVRPGRDAENDPLWAHIYKPENGYRSGEHWEILNYEKRKVYLVDFSLPIEDMKKLARVSDLVFIDHHKTALKAWFESAVRPPATVVGDIRYAACELVWAYFDNYKLEGIPEAVRLLGMYDSWRKDDPEWDRALAFQYGCRAVKNIYDPTDKVWEELFDEDGGRMPFDSLPHTNDNTDAVQPAEYVGQAILRYQAEVNRKACEAGAYEIVLHTPRPDLVAKFNEHIAEAAKDPVKVAMENPGLYSLVLPPGRGVRALACNTIINTSGFFGGFYDPEKHDVMVAYCQLATKKWKVSIYSTKDTIDCGAIAKLFGGGGHRSASGFVCDRLPWEK